VGLAHLMAMESPLVQAKMIEATGFPALAGKFGVSGVPHTTINKGFLIIGIEAGDTASQVISFIQQSNLTFPVWLDPLGK